MLTMHFLTAGVGAPEEPRVPFTIEKVGQQR